MPANVYSHARKHTTFVRKSLASGTRNTCRMRKLNSGLNSRTSKMIPSVISTTSERMIENAVGRPSNRKLRYQGIIGTALTTLGSKRR